MEIINVCEFKSKSCIDFTNIKDLIINLIINYYIDFDVYNAFIFSIDNDKAITKDNNLYVTYNKFLNLYEGFNIISEDKINDLYILIEKHRNILKSINISVNNYIKNIISIKIFGSGELSATVLFKIYRNIMENDVPVGVMKVISKIVPLQLPHHYGFIPSDEKNEFIEKYIEAPSYGIYIKEAWMYCFSKNILSKYTPTFTCIANCYILDGFPIQNTKELIKMVENYERVNDKKIAHKEWFDILLGPKNKIQNELKKIKYGVFEMEEIDGTLGNLYDKKGLFTLSIIFEYLYTKVISAFIGRIIFTDDHFDNIGYITVNYTRLYNIICNGCNYKFYIPPGKMIQFIDLEKYIFNYSNYDIYTNRSLEKLNKNEFNSSKLKSIIKTLSIEQPIDKSINTFLIHAFNKEQFTDPNEYDIMIKILKNPFVYDIKMFPHIMDLYMPKKYHIKPLNTPIYKYTINLDDNSLRYINISDINKNI